MENEIKPKRPTRKSILKHGAIAITALAICVILIVLGIYLFSSLHSSASENETTNSENTLTTTTS